MSKSYAVGNIEEFKLELRNIFAVLEHREEKEEDLETIWRQFKTVFTQTAENTIGKRQKEIKDWMSEATIKKIEERKDMKKKINISKSARVKEKFQIEYRRIDKEVKQMCRRDKGENMNNHIEHAEKAAQMEEQGILYRITKKISAKYKGKYSTLKDKE
jgi:hypothetical protein